MTELQKSVSQCLVDGNIVRLPAAMLPNYPDVKKAMLQAGGVYKKNTFVFRDPAQPIIDRLLGGEKINIKKEFQFFETPKDVARDMVQMADIKPGDKLLEPSAGRGRIVDAIVEAFPSAMIRVCELEPSNYKFLSEHPSTKMVCPDFLTIRERGDYNEFFDKIIANPPFANNNDIYHIYEMWNCLAPLGRIVTIASTHWMFAKEKKCAEFREFINEYGAEVTELYPGTFKESETMVRACIISIQKK